MHIVILDSLSVNPGDLSWDFLNQFGTVDIYDETPLDLAAERIGDAEIIVSNKTAISAELMDACPSIRLICLLATGYNIVDCDAARRRGIPVCNVPNYGTASVAQFAFSLLLELCNRVGLHDQSVHNGDWSACTDFCYWLTPQTELAGKTMGIIGFGHIGQAVARIADAMGMRVLAYSRTRKESDFAEFSDLASLLRRSDVVSLHCPLTEQTKGLIDANAISQMKRGAFLINTARGALIDEAAVAAALQAGQLGGYAADVVTVEPIEASNPLLGAPNCVLTPHMAWVPIECRKRILTITEENILAFLRGTPVNVVNP